MSSTLIKEQQDVTGEVYTALRVALEDNSINNLSILCRDESEEHKDFLERIYVEAEEDDMTADLLDFHRNNPQIIVAGGAPRDWSQGIVARDVDIYIMSHSSYFSEVLKSMGERVKYPLEVFSRQCEDVLKILLDNHGIVGYTLTDKTTSEDTKYNHVNSVFLVFEMKYKCNTFDLIFIDPYAVSSLVVKQDDGSVRNIHSSYIEAFKQTGVSFEEYVVSSFDFDVCRCYYLPSRRELTVTELAAKDFNNNTMTIYDATRRSLVASIFKHYTKIKAKYPSLEFNPTKAAE